MPNSVKAVVAGVSVCTLFACAPAHATPLLDVVFAMAANSAETAAGWADEQAYVEDAISEVLPAGETQVGVVQYATSVTTPIALTLVNAASVPTLESQVSKLKFTDTLTSSLSGLQAAINLLETDTNAGDTKLLVYLTNGDPSPPTTQNPCDLSGNVPGAAVARHDLSADGITLAEGYVGSDINTVTLSCLLQGNTADQFMLTDTASLRDLQTIVNATLPPTTSTSSFPPLLPPDVPDFVAPFAVPEPPSWTAFAFAAGAMLFWRRRAKAG